MTRNRTGNNKFLKKYNQTGILDIIRVKGQVSRVELSQITGLSPTATGVIVANLLEKGYIHETGIGDSRGGRRPVMLELKPNSFYSAGIDFDVGSVSIIITDIKGEPVWEYSDKIGDTPEIFSILKKALGKISEGLNKLSASYDRLLGLGISVPGMVDSENRKILLAPNLKLEGVEIPSDIEGMPGVRIYVENESKASAICENWIGCCQGINNFICINVRSGIGAGIFTDGKLYRGTGGSAGELGHIVVDDDGPRCGCGNYGCLETVASTTSIVEKAKKLVRQGAVSEITSSGNLEDMDIDVIAIAAENGDEAARSILLEAARYMGIAISNVVNTLNPSKIVLGKDFVKYGHLVTEHMEGVVKRRALKLPGSQVDITISKLGDRASTLGAAIIPLKVLFGR